MKRIATWIAPTATDPDLARQEYVLNVILVGLIGLDVLFTAAIGALWALGRDPGTGALTGLSVLPFYLLAYWLGRQGRVRLAALMVIAALFLAMVGANYQLGIGHSILIGYAVITLLASLLHGLTLALVLVLLSAVLHIVIGLAQQAGQLSIEVSPLDIVVSDGIAIGLGLSIVALLGWLYSRQMREALRRQQALSTELQANQAGLEQQVAGRTATLEQRSLHLEIAAQVAREAVAIRDVGQLLDATVRLISDRFGFYHAGIFLLDEPEEYAVLRAASSEGGRRMLARGHRLKVGEVGIVGYAAGTGEPRIALDVGADAVFFDNPDLPGTRSEMGLPLKVRERVIGVLDVQSTEEKAFSDEDVAILQTMADQVALAIDNARLLEESQRALRELETLYGQRAREAWQGRAARQPAAYHYTGVGVEPASATVAAHSLVPEEDGHQLTAPIRLRGQTLGSIVLQQDPDEETWSAEEIALVEEVSTQIGLALENARLLEETRRRAAREQALSQMTARFTRSLDVDAVLRTAVRELGQLPNVAEVSVHMASPDVPSPTNGGEER